jgi:4-diphosphocytidyl-2-C-methyl-D-erythritol kinase
MARAFGARIPNIAVELDKHIPVAAGLGGGSADAAATLRALGRLAGLDHKSREIHEVALSLGADVPVCLGSRACRMHGIGDGLEPLGALGPLPVVLANAGPALATAKVFAALGLANGESGNPPIDARLDLENARNDLTAPAMRLLPVIGEVLAALRSAPKAKFARMSGSGGACFALFDSSADAGHAAAELASRHPDWWIREAILS